jgi:outer membrane protein OmpA-like peptidoglycan-associated protein
MNCIKSLVVVFLAMNICLSQSSQEEFVVYFGNNSSALRSNELLKLNEFIAEANQYKYEISKVESYCDSVGTIEFNNELSLKRLQYIKTIFTQKAIEVHSYSSKGENHSLDNMKGKTNQENRKAVVYFKKRASDLENVLRVSSEGDKFGSVMNSLDKNATINLDLQFVGGTAQLLEDSYPELENLYQFLKANYELKSFIRGHVCCSDNMTLSTERAYTVYSLLIKKGIHPDRLDFKGFNRTVPVVYPELTEEDQQRNRRVDVVFSKLN